MESVNKWKELWLSAEPMEEEWPKGWKEKLQLF